MEYRSLTHDQVAHFREHGYVRIGKLLDDELVERLRDEYDRLFAEARADGRYRNLAIDDTDDIDAKANADGQMLQIMQMCERSLLFRQLLYDKRILDIVEDLIGPNIQLFHDQALYKPAHNGESVFWHQDNAYWQCLPAQLVSCWLTLDDVNADNGAMHVIPGSHLRPIEHERSAKTSALLDMGDQVDESKATVIDLPAGGVMFHHCQTWHYTRPNRTDRQRRAFAIHFMQPGTRGKTGEFLEVSFSRRYKNVTLTGNWRMSMSVNEVVPFFAVKDMEKSIAFYIDGLGFEFKNKWVDDGVLRWCQLQIGDAGLMLQQFRTEGHDSWQFSDNKGEGVTLCFFCDDAVEFYRDVKSRGIDASEPRVGNGLWVTHMTDPDGYELLFESPTDVAEDTKLSEVE